MNCQGLKNNSHCIARNIGQISNPELFCALCPAEQKIVKIAVIEKPVKCSFAKYTGRVFTGCKKCNGEIIECQNEKQWPKRRNSKTCNEKCRLFEPK